MRIEQTTSHHPIQRLYYLGIFTLLVALAILAVGCNRANKTAEEQHKGAAPMPTPPSDDTLGDTPIVISGGSIHLDFNKRMFTPCPSAPPLAPCPTPSPATDKAYFAQGSVSTAYIYNDNENTGNNPLELTRVAGKSTITIKGSNNAGLDDVVITSVDAADPANRIVTIELDETKCAPRKNGSRRRANKSTKIQNVIVVDNQNVRKEYRNQPGYPNNQKMTIEIQ